MNATRSPTRRNLLGLIGAAGGGSAMYLAMAALGNAAESTYPGLLELSGAPKGASVLSWARASPWSLGCYGHWTEATRKQHYANLSAMDCRILLASEHASYIPAWQEGAVLSALDAVRRLHARVMMCHGLRPIAGSRQAAQKRRTSLPRWVGGIRPIEG